MAEIARNSVDWDVVLATSHPEAANSSTQWLRTDQWADVASSLDHLTTSLSLAEAAPHEWKWVIIACHSAVQGALICVLSGSNGLKCLNEKSLRLTLQWYEASRRDDAIKRPRERLADFEALLERAYCSVYMAEFGGLPMPKDNVVYGDLWKLHEIRNSFAHFRPESWSIDLELLPRLIHSGASFAQRLLLGHPACTHRLSKARVQQYEAHFERMSLLLEAAGTKGLSRTVSALKRK